MISGASMSGPRKLDEIISAMELAFSKIDGRHFQSGQIQSSGNACWTEIYNDGKVQILNISRGKLDNTFMPCHVHDAIEIIITVVGEIHVNGKIGTQGVPIVMHHNEPHECSILTPHYFGFAVLVPPERAYENGK